MKRAKQYPFLSLQRQRFHLNFENASSAANLPSERDFYRWAWSALKNEYRRADISLILLDEEEARAYNRDYRGKDYATNVLSFALNERRNPCPDQFFRRPVCFNPGYLGFFSIKATNWSI